MILVALAPPTWLTGLGGHLKVAFDDHDRLAISIMIFFFSSVCLFLLYVPFSPVFMSIVVMSSCCWLPSVSHVFYMYNGCPVDYASWY